MSQLIQVRRGTEAERQTKVFASGELVWTTDTKKLYIGDGTTQGGVSIFQALALSDIPSGIDAAKIADGTVSNEEFQTLNGITDNIQAQLNNILDGTTAFSKVVADNITIDSNSIKSSSGAINFDDDSLSTNGSVKCNIFELQNVVNYSINLYLGSPSNAKWYVIATITLTAQYEGVTVKGYTGVSSGLIDSLEFEFRVKQNDPLGSPPVSSLKFVKHTTNSNFKAIITQNNASATVVKLYAYSPNDFSTLFYNIFSDSYKCTPATTPISGLGAGTDITATAYYSALMSDNIKIDGNTISATSTGNVNITPGASGNLNLTAGALQLNAQTIIASDRTLKPVTLADTAAANNSIYYSSTQSKLVYKDSGGVVRVLY